MRSIYAATKSGDMKPTAWARVLAFDQIRRRGKTSGIDLAQISPKGADVFHIRDGKVVKGIVYFEHARALADLGLED